MHTLDGKQPSGSFPESAMPGAAGRSFGWLRVYSITLGELGLLHRGSERQGFVASRFKILAAVLHVHLSVCRTVLRPRTVLSVQCVV